MLVVVVFCMMSELGKSTHFGLSGKICVGLKFIQNFLESFWNMKKSFQLEKSIPENDRNYLEELWKRVVLWQSAFHEKGHHKFGHHCNKIFFRVEKFIVKNSYGAAHTHCKLNAKQEHSYFIPIIIHKKTEFGSHFFPNR